MAKKKPSAKDDFWLSYRQGVYSTPRAWAMKGENLVHAFEAVADASVEGDINFDMTDQALMLAGMAIEAKFKAIILEDKDKCDVVSGVREPTTKREEKLRDKTFYTHDLVKLAKEADVSLSKQETEVAKALSVYILWRGRYAMPTQRGIHDIIPIKHDNGLVGPPHHHVTHEEATELIDHVVAEVKSRLYNKT